MSRARLQQERALALLVACAMVACLAVANPAPCVAETTGETDIYVTLARPRADDVAGAATGDTDPLPQPRTGDDTRLAHAVLAATVGTAAIAAAQRVRTRRAKGKTRRGRKA